MLESLHRLAPAPKRADNSEKRRIMTTPMRLILPVEVHQVQERTSQGKTIRKKR